MAEGFDDLADFLGERVALAALLAGLEISRQRTAALLDEPRQIARKLLDVDTADFHRFLRWSPHERSSIRAARHDEAVPQVRNGLLRSGAQGTFFSIRLPLLVQDAAKRAPSGVLVSTYYDASLNAWVKSQGTFITC
jgi:hypothetical protein